MGLKILIATAVVASLVIGFGTGILLGHFVTSHWAEVDEDKTPATERPAVPKSMGTHRYKVNESPASYAQRVIKDVDEDRIRQNLKYLTSKSHVAGSAVSLEQAEWVRDSWLDQGLDKAEVVSYNVLLSYPPEKDDAQQNRIELLTSSGGAVEFTTQLREPPLDPDTDFPVEDPDILAPYNAYSASGEIEGDLVYVNYGRVEDFQELERVLNIDVTGKICIARYAKIFRGNKVLNAERAGCVGLILYSDPDDYALPGVAVYPDGIYLPGTGTQRGTVRMGSGDPLTPGYPAVASAYRVPVSSLSCLPSIPVHPIGYNDAAHFLRRLGGSEVGDEWKGRLPGVTYRHGPGFNEKNRKKKVAMKIFTENRMADAYNTIGTIRGSVEPDRYVIIGNHRDAWGYGAIDPSSGTACMMEISRVFGSLIKDGWRPRRTIMFGSWGAEEFGIIGSNEWVEEHAKKLGARTVSYLNLDEVITGTHVVEIDATPNLYKLIYNAARKIPDPNPEGRRQTVYDTWKERDLVGNTDEGHPHINTLGSGSDFMPFLQILGISAIHFKYSYDKTNIPISGYPMYHSVYETFNLVDRYYDPGFKYHRAMTQLVAEIARNLAESTILPMDVAVYADYVKEYYENLREGAYGQRLTREGYSFGDMKSAVKNLTQAANAFMQKVRMLNDQLHLFERAFSDPLFGLPDHPFLRHILFAPSSRDKYSGDKFPGIVDAMFDIDNNPDPEKWNIVKKQLSIAIFTIQSAASVLTEVA